MASGILFDGVATSRPTDWAHQTLGADGRAYILARAHGALTAKTPYLVYQDYDGLKTVALFDTGLASISAGQNVGGYKIGVPNSAVSSDTDGWLQVGGYCSNVVTQTCTGPISGVFCWVDASITCNELTAATATGGAGVYVNSFAVCAVSATGVAAHQLVLLNKFVFGIT